MYIKPKRCESCKQSFKPKHNKARYCCRNCWFRGYYQRKLKKKNQININIDFDNGQVTINGKILTIGKDFPMHDGKYTD
jgi:protein-arginine kinase activator protein McsA